MRGWWFLGLPFLSLACWLGEPYEPITFCIESDVEPTTVDGRVVHHHAGTLVSDAWNDDNQDPVGECGVDDVPLPEWIFRIEDAQGNETRFGYTVPELERPIDEDEDDVVTIHAVIAPDPDTFGFMIFNGDCAAPESGECLVEMIADDGLGGRVLGDEMIAPYEVARGDEFARRNGVCGKVEYHRLEVGTGGTPLSLGPGSYDEVNVSHGVNAGDAFVINVDNHIWAVDSCGDADERFSYVVMRHD